MPHDATIHLSFLFYEIWAHVCFPWPDHTLEAQRTHAGERDLRYGNLFGRVTVSGNKTRGFMYFFSCSFLRRGGKLGGVGAVFSRGSVCYGVLGAFYTGLDWREDIMFGHHGFGSCMPGFTPCEIPKTKEGGTEPTESRGGESK